MATHIYLSSFNVLRFKVNRMDTRETIIHVIGTC